MGNLGTMKSHDPWYHCHDFFNTLLQEKYKEQHRNLSCSVAKFSVHQAGRLLKINHLELQEDICASFKPLIILNNKTYHVKMTLQV